MFYKRILICIFSFRFFPLPIFSKYDSTPKSIYFASSDKFLAVFLWCETEVLLEDADEV